MLNCQPRPQTAFLSLSDPPSVRSDHDNHRVAIQLLPARPIPLSRIAGIAIRLDGGSID